MFCNAKKEELNTVISITFSILKDLLLFQIFIGEHFTCARHLNGSGSCMIGKFWKSINKTIDGKCVSPRIAPSKFIFWKGERKRCFGRELHSERWRKAVCAEVTSNDLATKPPGENEMENSFRKNFFFPVQGQQFFPCNSGKVYINILEMVICLFFIIYTFNFPKFDSISCEIEITKKLGFFKIMKNMQMYHITFWIHIIELWTKNLFYQIHLILFRSTLRANNKARRLIL